MKKNIFLTIVLGSLFFSGCTSIMKDTSLIREPNKKKAIVNFVNPWNYFGYIHIWEGERYIGLLDLASIIQIEVEAGKHTFMANGSNWSYVSGNLVAGKQYFIKTNPLPYGGVALGVAKSDDKRVDEWLDELTPMVVAIEKDRKEIEMERKKEVQEKIADFEEGRVSRFATIYPKDGHLVVFHPKVKKKEPLLQGL